MFKIKRLSRSFGHAVSGLRCALREQNFLIELLAAVVALALAGYCRIGKADFTVLFLVIILVLILEIINTIFERVIDILVPRQHPYAKVIKDMMAGAVLLACLGSIVVGWAIFYPHWETIKSIF